MKTIFPAVSAVAAAFAAALLAGCERSDSADGLSWTQNQQQQPAATGSAATGSSSSSQRQSSGSQGGSSSSSQSSSSTSAASTGTPAPVQTYSATGTTTTPAAAPAANPAPASDSGSSDGSSAGSGSSGGDPGTGGDSGSTQSADQVPFGSLQWKYGGVRGGGASASGVSISGISYSRNGLSFRYGRDLSAWGYSNSQTDGIACLFVQNNSGAWVGGKFDWISSSRKSRDFNNIYSGYAGWSLADVPNPCQAAFVIISRDAKKRSNVIVGTWSR